LHVGFNARHEQGGVVRFTVDVLFGRAGHRSTYEIISAGIFVHPHIGTDVIDCPIDHVGNCRPISTVAQVRIEGKAGHRIYPRPSSQVAEPLFVQGVIFTYVEHFDLISHK
jgi:hypothetical protein